MAQVNGKWSTDGFYGGADDPLLNAYLKCAEGSETPEIVQMDGRTYRALGGDIPDVVERLCKLSSKVYERVDGIHAADCFCGTGGNWDIAPDHYGPTHKQGYRNDGVVLKFIEQSVRAALRAHRGKIR